MYRHYHHHHHHQKFERMIWPDLVWLVDQNPDSFSLYTPFQCSSSLDGKGYSKGRKLAGKAKGGGGRCGERAVCEELGGTKWRVSLMMLMMMMLMMLIATGIEPSHSTPASKKARWGGGANISYVTVKCRSIVDWRFQAPPIPCSLARQTSALPLASFCK